MSGVESLIQASVVIPSQEAEVRLEALSDETEQAIASGGDVLRAVSACLHEGQTVAVDTRQSVLERAGEGAEAATDELGMLDRRKVHRAAKSIRVAEEPRELREFTRVFDRGSPLRRIVGLHYVASQGLEQATDAIPFERARRVGAMMMGLGLTGEEKLVSQRALLMPGMLSNVSRAGVGLFTGQIVSGDPGGLHVSYRHPFKNYPDEIKDTPYLTSAAKYWVLGGAAENIMWGQPSVDTYLDHLPEWQRPLFQSVAEAVQKVRTANFMRHFEKLRTSRAQWDGANAADASPESAPAPEFDLKAIITNVRDEGCANTLQLMDKQALSRAIADIRDMREANAGITDRDVYISFMGKLEGGHGAMSEEDYSTLTETVSVMNLLLGGKVSKNADFPLGV